MRGIEPEVHTDGSVNLSRARHPLIPTRTSWCRLPCSLGVDFDTLIITGPNTGGKTVTLKTIGLLTLMAECGLHIPADDGSFISVFDAVLADIGDEQSIEQSLSTFSSHMKNIVEIVSSLRQRFAGALRRAGRRHRPRRGCSAGGLRHRVLPQDGREDCRDDPLCRAEGLRHEAPTGVTNASCEFDVETLRPTYRLLVGIPGKSNAFNISRRLGLPEEIIKDARDLVNESDLNFEDVMDQLEQQRQADGAGAGGKLSASAWRPSSRSSSRIEYYAEIKREREKAVQKARAEAQHIIDDARFTANKVFEELKQMRKQLQENLDAQGLNAQQTALRRSLNEAEAQLGEQKEQVERPKPSRGIRAGDTVELLKLGSKATVLAVNKDGSLQLQAGIMKITARQDEVYLLEQQEQTVKKFIERTNRELRAAPTASGTGPARHDHRRGHPDHGGLPRQRHSGQSGLSPHYPRQGDRRAAQGGTDGAAPPERHRGLPAGRLWRGRGRRHHRPAERIIPLWAKKPRPGFEIFVHFATNEIRKTIDERRRVCYSIVQILMSVRI